MCDPLTFAGKVSMGCLKCIIKHLLLFAGQVPNAATAYPVRWEIEEGRIYLQVQNVSIIFSIITKRISYSNKFNLILSCKK